MFKGVRDLNLCVVMHKKFVCATLENEHSHDVWQEV